MPLANNKQRKTGLITGAASGLGRAIALRLAHDGWNLALADVNDEACEETLRLVRQAGGDGFVEHLDVRYIEEWQALRDRLQAQWSQLDLLVNNAGVAGSGRVGDYSIENWHWIVDVNLWNGINGCHTFVDWLKANPAGAHIINTCSLAAIVSAPTMGAYNVTKAGMLALSETLYSELLPFNVGVTALCPSVFRTNLLDKSRWCQPEERKLFEKGFAQTKMTAEFVADAAIRAMQRKQLYVLVPFESRFNWYLKRLAPTWLLRKVSRMFESQLQAAAKWESAGAPTKKEALEAVEK
ncbi:MAG TPA: SDR family NAD(P)-dependent oxidoreductase [Planctomycetaceae bacterium]|jgi:NAD(P)-dependent dehydrogenase (short-subunit alcohol dehydrogenase family)|nr:SDR family NAD(P)-dependent oxidoreductase [Planctomycetaceae bacterium]